MIIHIYNINTKITVAKFTEFEEIDLFIFKVSPYFQNLRHLKHLPKKLNNNICQEEASLNFWFALHMYMPVHIT